MRNFQPDNMKVHTTHCKNPVIFHMGSLIYDGIHHTPVDCVVN